MKPLYVIRSIIAWLTSPIVFLYLVPLFILMDYLMEDDDSALNLIGSWRRWAFIDYRKD